MSLDTLGSAVTSREPSQSLSPLYWVAIVLAAVTGVLHIWLGVIRGKPPLILGGIGFAIGITLVLLNVRRDLVVKLGIPYTAGQILLYAIGHYPNEYALNGLVDKTVQVVLVAVLVVLMRRQ